MDETEMSLPQENADETENVEPNGEAAAAQENTESEEREKLSAAQTEVSELLSQYPGLSPEDIPADVWRDYSMGRGGLTLLYTRSENMRLKADNDSLRQRIAELEQAAENSRRSTNSRRSAGTSAGSIIDSIWYSD